MKRIILVGRSGSGKDFLRKDFERQGIPYEISYTTRPPRVDEENGKDYFFISEDKFDQMVEDNKWYENQRFGSYRYGTTKDQFYKDQLNVLIMSPNGIAELKKEDRNTSFVIFLDPQNKDILYQRLKKRGWTEEKIQSRIVDDNKQFESFQISLPGMRILDPWFDAKKIVNQVLMLSTAVNTRDPIVDPPESTSFSISVSTVVKIPVGTIRHAEQFYS